MVIGKSYRIKIDGLVAGNFWIYQFKKKHKVVSRKFAKLVTTRDVDDRNSVDQSADRFVDNAYKIMDNYDHNFILNIDRSGLQLEIFCNRTFTYQGEMLALSSIKSVNNSTRSYTVKPVISTSRHLVSPLFLYLKESGRIGDLAKRAIFSYLTSSSSLKN